MLFVKPVFAACPVCVAALGGGLWIAEKLGVDDLIVSIWIGALVSSTALWFAKRMKLPKSGVYWVVIFYLLTLGTFYLWGKLSNPSCQIWGFDKIGLGVTLGTVSFGSGILLDFWLRSKNRNRVFFPFQKVVCPLVLVLLTTLLFYFILCQN